MSAVTQLDAFEKAKRRYFAQLGVRLHPAFNHHRTQGMLAKNANRQREWGNVVEHCLVEAARAIEFGLLLQLPASTQANLVLAAGLHDFYKKSEKAIVTQHGLSWESFEAANRQAAAILAADPDLPAEVVSLTGAVGHTSLEHIEQLLACAPDAMSAYQIAFLVMHYVDDYTSGSSWAEPGDLLEARMRKNAGNPRYRVVNAAGIARFHGLTTFEQQLKLGRAVESRLAGLITRAGEVVLTNASELPLLVDARIREKIQRLMGEP